MHLAGNRTGQEILQLRMIKTLSPAIHAVIDRWSKAHPTCFLLDVVRDIDHMLHQPQ